MYSWYRAAGSTVGWWLLLAPRQPAGSWYHSVEGPGVSAARHRPPTPSKRYQLPPPMPLGHISPPCPSHTCPVLAQSPRAAVLLLAVRHESVRVVAANRSLPRRPSHSSVRRAVGRIHTTTQRRVRGAAIRRIGLLTPGLVSSQLTTVGPTLQIISTQWLKWHIPVMIGLVAIH